MARLTKVLWTESCALELDEGPYLPYNIKIARRGGRVVEGSGLENQRGASLRGFESHPLRHIFTAAL